MEKLQFEKKDDEFHFLAGKSFADKETKLGWDHRHLRI
jgi:hypothetical protein